MLYLSAGLFNLFLQTASESYSYFLLVLAVIQGVIWYFSRFHQQFKKMALLFMLFFTLVVAPMNWFYNAGSQGPTLLLYLIAI